MLVNNWPVIDYLAMISVLQNLAHLFIIILLLSSAHTTLVVIAEWFLSTTCNRINSSVRLSQSFYLPHLQVTGSRMANLSK